MSVPDVMIPLILLCLVPVSLMQKASNAKIIMEEFGGPPIALYSAPPSLADVSPQCIYDLRSLLNNTDVLIPVLDSYGKPTPGLLVGNLAWLGHFDECMAVSDYRYCLLSMGVNLTKALNVSFELPINWGVCVPESCSENDVGNSTELLLEYLDVSWLKLESMIGSAVNCNDKPNTNFDGGFIAVCVLLSLFSALSVAGSILDHFLQSSTINQTIKSSLDTASTAANNMHYSHQNGYASLDAANEVKETPISDNSHQSTSHSEKTPLLIDSRGSQAGQQSAPSVEATGSKQQNVCIRLLLCFAFTCNLPKLLSTKQAKDGIVCLNGIRVISMSWVILGHTLALTMPAGLNENSGIIFPKWLTSFPFQAILNAYFSVDSFFFLSGLLLTYLTLKKMKATEGTMAWGWFYIHRYLRLTPAIAILVLIIIYIMPNMSQGPVWYVTDSLADTCRSWWWTTLLYINNFYPSSLIQICAAWTWYLANDMQFFLISPFVIVPLFWYPKIGFTILGVLCSASFITTSVLVHHYGFSPSVTQGLIPQANPGTETNVFSSNSYMDVIYTKPYCRIPPYLVGMAMGYFIYRFGTKRIKVSPVMSAAGWAAATALGITVVYGLYDVNSGSPINVAASMAYTSLATFTWGVALSWVVFACHYGYGGIINDFLSWSAWVPLSRLTYFAYLLHPLVITLYANSMTVPVHWSAITIAYIFTAYLVLAYGSALLLSLLVEFPFGNLEKMLQQALSKRKA